MFIIGAYVTIKPLEGRHGRVMDLEPYEDGCICVVRYILDGDVRIMRYLEDELDLAEA